jgi:hypothetical protein
MAGMTPSSLRNDVRMVESGSLSLLSTYLTPASRTSTVTSGSSVRRFATTSPAVPAGKYFQFNGKPDSPTMMTHLRL